MYFSRAGWRSTPRLFLNVTLVGDTLEPLLQSPDLFLCRNLLVVLDRVRTELLLSGIQTVRRYPQTLGNIGHRITELHHLLDGLDLELIWISFATHYSPL